MRPLKLTMTAFGPYKEREVIDFAKLEDRRLFVISGNTGAGKTTIFDAICFVLYGTASGEDRYDSRMLRSHFADEDTHTSVELEFAVGRRVYRVFRQLGHKKGTNKTETGAKAELYERVGRDADGQGQEVPSVDRFVISDVNEKIESILGLTNAQFSQIVMLPQGEFRKLLTSETENKEEILRRIFKTELYQRMEDRFQQKTRELRTALMEAQTEMDVYVRQISDVLPEREDSTLFQTLSQQFRNTGQILEGLGAEQAFYIERMEQSKEAKRALQDGLNEKEGRFQEAKARNERFLELERKTTEKKLLDGQLADVAEKEQRVRLADKAALLEPYEEQWQRAMVNEEQKRTAYEAKKLEAQTAADELEQADRRKKEEEQREEERKTAEREQERLLELKPSVQMLQVNRQEVEQLQREEQQLSRTVEANEQEMNIARQTKQTTNERIKQLERETAVLPERKETLLRQREQAKLMKDALDMECQIGEYTRLEAERQRVFHEMKAEHDRMEHLWIEGQASLLAAHLHDGSPCPVCGSSAHPNKADSNVEIPNKDELQRVKELLRHHESAYNEVKLQLAATQTGFSSKQNELSSYDIPEHNIRQQYEKLVQEGTRVKEETERLEGLVKQLQVLRQETEQLDEKLDKLAKAKDDFIKQLQEIKLQRQTKQTLLEKDLERIPEDLRTPEQLSSRLLQQQAHVGQLNRNWQEALASAQRTHAKWVEENTHFIQLGNQLEEAKTLLQEADTRLKHELTAAGFTTIDAYRETKLTAQQRSDLQAEVERFKTTHAAVSQQILELKRELAGQAPSDLEQLQNDITQCKQELEQLASTHQLWLRRHQDAERLSVSIAVVHERTKETEGRLQQLKDIYDVLRGDNPLKMSFERYILIEYLELILHAANVRLRAFSNGQFALRRSDRLEKHNRQSGLGLDVYDAYTGQNRDVKSLSGGEKFNASLCLALGMSDVIQSFQGGVSIEMMFIDEGFGSLDEDALNQAIETLIDLQKSGRLIGVISHVQELKAAFPAILEVRKTKDGSSQTVMILK